MSEIPLGYITVTQATALADERVEAMRTAAATASHTALLLHEITPDVGPFTLQQRSADEAREQIAERIMKLPIRPADASTDYLTVA